jgi:hypothetical protein
VAWAFVIFGCRQSEHAGREDQGDLSIAIPALQAVANDESSRDPRRWRLAPVAELQRVMFFASHILIRHADAEPRMAPLVLPPWAAMPSPGMRSSEAAKQLAVQLFHQVKGMPESFAEVARQHSEDVTTRDAGGRLGGMMASNLLSFPQVIDVLGALPIGEVSVPVESAFGYHLFLRRGPPEKAPISARRILVGYGDADFLRFNERIDAGAEPRPWRQRSPEAARQIAVAIATELQATPESFDALLATHSDHWDVAQGGDVGVWSRREWSPFPRELEVLAGLPVGGITAALDSPFGVSVWQRTAVVERPSYAMKALRFRFNPVAEPDASDSKQQVWRIAERVAQELRQEPAAFRSYEAQYGLGPAQRWTAGRGFRNVEAVVRALQVGQVSSQAFDADGAFMIVRRISPEEAPAPEEALEQLPNPRAPDPSFLAMVPNEQRNHLITNAAEQVGVMSGSNSESAGRLARMQEQLGTELEQAQDADAQAMALAHFFLRLKRLLGVDAMQRFQDSLDQSLEKELMP